LSKLKFILSGGGTGGHIFPAVSIAKELKKRYPDTEILFVGAKGKMEMEKVPASGFPIVGLWISGLQRKLTFSNLLFPFKVISSLIKAKKIISEFKPDVVIGTGGFASGPTLKAAASAGIPTLIQEQNSYPGITNKILSSKAKKICVAYEGLEKYFPKEKIILTGNPVRSDLLDVKNKRNEALQFFALNETLPVVLIIGGSLGARTLNESIEHNIDWFKKEKVQIIWQTGKAFFEKARILTHNNDDKNLKSFDFIQRMDLAYAAANIIISRAGASSISELCIVGKPTILVPSPNVAEDHQTKNAMALVTKKAAILIKDVDCKRQLCSELHNLLTQYQLQEELSISIQKLAQPNATEQIVNEIEKLLKQ
jgi:UDP-N-acetylglucosamine--N-acetylmuramyl-(pentapeptide) pyrophosphoryl-undecaprenol N-acetylglucosamine transferase